MVIKLYGRPLSTATRRVAVVLVEKKVPFEFILIDVKKGEGRTPEFLAKQPFGQIPVIDDDGFILYESRAICRYIAEKYRDQGTQSLVPRADDDPRVKALFEQAASVEVNNFEPYASVAVREMRKKLRGLEVDMELCDAQTKSLASKLEGYELILGRNRFLTGENLTLVDLFHLPFGEGLVLTGYNLLTSPARYPNVARWWAEVSDRSSWKVVKDGIKSIQSYA